MFVSGGLCVSSCCRLDGYDDDDDGVGGGGGGLEEMIAACKVWLVVVFCAASTLLRCDYLLFVVIPPHPCYSMLLRARCAPKVPRGGMRAIA